MADTQSPQAGPWPAAPNLNTRIPEGECLLSILIPTMQSRLPLYTRLHEELTRQCNLPGAGPAVEILTLSDDGSERVGTKRNQLMDRANGRFLVFADNDDRISRDRALQQEAAIDAELYYYDSRRPYAWQWLLDKTQPIRHALGLTSVNWLSVYQRLRTLIRHSPS